MSTETEQGDQTLSWQETVRATAGEVTEADLVKARAEKVQGFGVWGMMLGALAAGLGLVGFVGSRGEPGPVALTIGGAALCAIGFGLVLLAQLMHIRAEVMRKS